MNEFFPNGDFETALMSAKAGRLPHTEMLSLFLATRIVVSSAARVAADGTGFQPLEFSKETVQMLGCFTSAERIADFSRVAPFYVEMTGMRLLQRLPSDHGVVINPGWPVGFDISPQGVAKILVDFTC